MKKYCGKVKEFIKKNQLLCIAILAVIVLAIFVYVIFFKLNITTIKFTKKVSGSKNYSVECLDTNCDYIVASKGDQYGKYTTNVYSAKGKKIAKLNNTYDSKASYTESVVEASKNYIITSKVDYSTKKEIGYVLKNTNGKAKYNSKTELKAITDYLISEKTNDGYKIINYKGKTLYKDVKSLETFGNKEVVSIITKSENLIVDAKGKSILSGYRIVSEVFDKKGKVLYFVLQDAYKNSYYYYDYKNDKLDEDSFNGYISGNNAGELIITESKNGTYKKYLLNKDGKRTELYGEDSNEIIETIKKKVDSEKYYIYTGSIGNEKTKYVLANDRKNNTAGIYNVSSKKYTKLVDYSKENGTINLRVLNSEEDDLYIMINCSESNCKKNTTIVYDMKNNNKELFRTESGNMPEEYTSYKDGYSVVKYDINSSEEYKQKYVVYDKNNKELYKSDNQVIIVNKKLIFGEESSNKLVLFDVKNNKAINSEESLATKIIAGDSTAYKYSDNKNTYIVSNNGKLLAKMSNDNASFTYSEDTIIYVENSKINIVNIKDNKVKSYRLKKNEKINDNSGQSIYPYKNTIYVNNTVNNYVKVINANGHVVKKINGASINRVTKNQKTNRVILITKKIKDNNNLYGLYILK
ncbi:MAG: hypothetical protein IKP98_02190 [Bacilli bacterium]|nr:hypothetical protein [Bacilli bacterium]